MPSAKSGETQTSSARDYTGLVAAKSVETKTPLRERNTSLRHSRQETTLTLLKEQIPKNMLNFTLAYNTAPRRTSH